MEMLNSLAMFYGAVYLFVTWKLLNWVWLKPKKLEKYLREQGLKGNSYRLLFGDTKEMLASMKQASLKPITFSDSVTSRVIPHLEETVKKHGKNSFFWLGPRPTVMIMDPELIKEISVKYNTYEKPHINPFIKWLSLGVVTYEGDKWVKHRRIINPAFHKEKLMLMIPAFNTSICEMIAKWEAAVSSSGTGSAELNVWNHLQNLTGDTISRTAFGRRYEDGRKIFELQIEQGEYFINAIRHVYIPGWRFVPTKRNRRMREINKTVNAMVQSIIDARLKTMKEGEPCQNDLLGILLESNAKEIDQHGNKEFGLSMQDVIEECKLFYLAGQETTSVLLVWTMVMLSKHPEWQARAREEVFNHFGQNQPVYDGLDNLKVVTMILNEVLRLYTPIGVLNRIITEEEVKLGDLTLPAGVLLCLPTMLMHCDSELWGDDAKEFRPERFANGVSNATKGQLAFFPFGWGPRICIGQNFAILEARLAIAMILQRFFFELSPSYAHAPLAKTTLQPQFGVHLTLYKL